jgi:spore coat polysaccharide biosynthesis protein SpsF (cytidylyltransferase family)
MYIVFILQCKKSSKRLPNCLMRTETIVVLIVLNGRLCDVRDYTVIVFYNSSTWIKYQKIFANTEV